MNIVRTSILNSDIAWNRSAIVSHDVKFQWMSVGGGNT